MAAALAASGYLLNATGFDVALQGNQTDRAIQLMRLCDAFIPFLTSGIAISLANSVALQALSKHSACIAARTGASLTDAGRKVTAAMSAAT